ncbi:protein AMBP [Pseudophryne corroboree]|uniref:protein AMBP n=1 Tax=Pseudophryne corroboree TaxID=495146 RepID=UPI0030815410
MKMHLFLLAAVLASVTADPAQADVPTQENFDVTRFFGKWYDVAIGSTCKWLMAYKDKYDMGTMELYEGQTDNELQVISTRMRRGRCSQYNSSYEKTDVPGKFNYFIEKYGAEFKTYVVFTNYYEYATLLMRKTKRGETTTTVKLYGRTPELRQSLIDDFKQFAMEQGVLEEAIFTLRNKGECSPGDIEVTHRRSQRAAANEEEEGSGGLDNTAFTKNRAASCHVDPAPGPCLGSKVRYFYNSSSMACETFRYGGCLGNYNNFETERYCLQTCRTEAACRLPIVTGPCKVSQNRWAFDSTVGKCIAFQYGGCKGNGNHFYTEKECKEYCGIPANDNEEFI